MRLDDWMIPILDGGLAVEGRSIRILEQLERKDYLGINKVLDALGGKWNRKAKAHLFDREAGPLVDAALAAGEVVSKKSDLGFFETPMALEHRRGGTDRPARRAGNGSRDRHPKRHEASEPVPGRQGLRCRLLDVDASRQIRPHLDEPAVRAVAGRSPRPSCVSASHTGRSAHGRHVCRRSTTTSGPTSLTVRSGRAAHLFGRSDT